MTNTMGFIRLFALVTVFGFSLTTCDDGNVNTTACSHNWGEWTVITAPTCVATGVDTRACIICGELDSNTVILISSEHNWGEWSEANQATETTDGIQERICKNSENHKESRVKYYATGTAGLEYELIENNTAFRIIKGTLTSGEVFIPAFYRLNVDSEYLPVTEISSSDIIYYDAAFFEALITAINFLSPSNITYIGNSAFRRSNLTTISLPEGLISIGNRAFAQLLYIEDEEINLPTTLVSIGDAAFSSLDNIKEIILPASLTYIGLANFTNCSSLTSVTFLGTISANNFIIDENNITSFSGDLREKYLSGGIGTYTREAGSEIWTKQ